MSSKGDLQHYCMHLEEAVADTLLERIGECRLIGEIDLVGCVDPVTAALALDDVGAVGSLATLRRMDEKGSTGSVVLSKAP